jgi:hypothetical protein
MTLLIVSTSTVHGKPYLSYLDEEVPDFFASKEKHLVCALCPAGWHQLG